MVVKVTFTASDQARNSNSCVFYVKPKDTEPPTLTCPSRLVFETDEVDDTVSSNVAWTVGELDNYKLRSSTSSIPQGGCVCMHVSRVCTCIFDDVCVCVNCVSHASDLSSPYDPPSGSVFSLGNTTVTHTAVDTYGNTASCSFVVSVVAKEEDAAPVSAASSSFSIVPVAAGAAGAICVIIILLVLYVRRKHRQVGVVQRRDGGDSLLFMFTCEIVYICLLSLYLSLFLCVSLSLSIYLSLSLSLSLSVCHRWKRSMATMSG